MTDPDDETRNLALAVVAGVVMLVISGVIAIAAMRFAHHGAGATEALAKSLAPVETLFFAPGSDQLTIDATQVLVRVADSARVNGNAMVVVSRFQAATADPASEAALARSRVLAVRHALEANGISPERVLVGPPEVASGEPKQAERVELRLE